MKFKFITLFADGGASTSGGDVGATTVASASTESEASKLGKQKVEINPEAIEEMNASIDKTTSATNDSEERKSFKDLIDSDEEYKKEYNASIEKAIQKRFKGVKETEDKLSSLGPALSVLAHYYELDPNDTDGIIEAVKGDDNYFKKAAIKNGNSTEQERRQFELEQENRRVKRELESKKEEEEKQRIFEQWDREIPEIQRLYPSFNMDVEMQNKMFARVAATSGLRAAYEVVHRDEINAAMIQYAQQRAASQVAQTVASNKSRPTENGLSNNATPVVQVSPKDMSKEQREDIKRRARLGEKIYFGRK